MYWDVGKVWFFKKPGLFRQTLSCQAKFWGPFYTDLCRALTLPKKYYLGIFTQNEANVYKTQSLHWLQDSWDTTGVITWTNAQSQLDLANSKITFVWRNKLFPFWNLELFVFWGVFKAFVQQMINQLWLQKESHKTNILINVLKSWVSYSLRSLCREEYKVKGGKLLQCAVCSSGHSILPSKKRRHQIMRI